MRKISKKITCAILAATMLGSAFTGCGKKEKLDGTVYLLAFTLEDGTQYIIEIDAKTGHVNTVDVILVSADTSDYIGLAAAKKIALERTGLTDSEDSVLFTKAKICCTIQFIHNREVWP